MTINYRFVAVRSNFTSVTQQRGKFCRLRCEARFRCEAFQNTAGARIGAEWALGKLAEDTLFYRKIVFNQKAHFRLNGYVNKQNYRFWSEGYSEALQKLPVYPEKVTVWCGL